MKLRWKVTAALAGIAALVSVLGAAAAYVTASSRLYSNVDQSLRRSVAVVNGEFSGFGSTPATTPATAPAVTTPLAGANPSTTTTEPVDGSSRSSEFRRPAGCPRAGPLQSVAAAQLVAADGKVTQCLDGALRLPVDAADRQIAAHGGKDRLRTVTVDGVDYRVVTIARHAGGAFQSARSLAEIDDVLGSLRNDLMIIGLVGTSLAALLGWYFARRLVRPIESLTAAAEHVATTQDLTVPLPAEGRDEVGSLTHSFTEMIDALASSRDQQQRLISDASHELRTPLTSLQANAQLLEHLERLNPDQIRRAVSGVRNEVIELTTLVSEIVELATDQSAATEPPEVVHLGDVARSVAQRARHLSSHAIVVTVDGDDLVVGHPAMLERAVTNLVGNATKYSPPDRAVDILVEGTRLDVLDRGPGISEVDLPHIFDRFYRAVEVRTESGSGLGLSIVQQIIELHGGTVRAVNRPGGGAIVGFELPAPDAAPLTANA